jgi:oligopeptide transport system permease protein
MARYLLRRLLAGLVTLWVVASLSFGLMRLAPGGPFQKDKPLAPAVEANLRRTFGLAEDVPSPLAGTLVKFIVQPGQEVTRGQVLALSNLANGQQVQIVAPYDMQVLALSGQPGRALHVGDPVLARATTAWQQYGHALWSYAHLDFGVTYASEGAETVLATLAKAFPVSLELGFLALLLALVLGVSAGLISGLYPNSRLDHLSMTGALLAVSMSSIVLGPLLKLIFCVNLRWFDVGGWQPLALDWPHVQVKILPVLTLGLIYAAWFARLTRAGMLEVVRQDFIRTARAKGLPEHLVVMRHAFRGAILPVVSFLGPALAGIVTGSTVIEQVFQVPGVGEFFVTSAVNRDYPMVMGTVVLYSSLLIAANLLVDLLQAALDPRVRADV